MSMVHTVVSTPLGEIILACDGSAMAGIWFEGQTHGPETRHWRRDDSHPLLRQAGRQILAYLNGETTELNLPMKTDIGTPFQREVWQQVSRIGRGHVCSYADIAIALGRPKASRAVGAAVGRNPWLLLVPCHRVVGRNGRLTGYAAGLARKQSLLRMEGALH